MSGTQQVLLAGAGAGDPNYASVVSLLHFDGTNGSQAFTDEKGKVWTPSNIRTWTFLGNAQLDTAQKLYGLSSLLLDGTGDYLNLADDVNFELGNGDFTIEAAIRINSAAGQMAVFSKYATLSNQRSYIFDINTSTNVIEFIYSLNGSTTTTVSGSFTWATNTWYQVAVSRVGTTIYLFVDGTLITSSSGIGTGTIFNSTASIHVGAFNAGGGAFNGWIDEVRLTKGVGRYTATYTAPSAEFPNSVSADASYGSVTSLLHFNGVDAATTTIDSAFGPGIDATTVLFGSGSLNTSPIAQISTPHNADFSFGSGNFTIEAAVRSTSFAAAQTIFSKYLSGINERSYIFRINSGGTALQFLYSLNGTAVDETVSGAFAFSTNTWYKAAVSRVGTTIYLFVDGALVGSSATIGTSALHPATPATPIISGHNSGGLTDFLVGNTDEFRVTKGVGRYSATYTPQSAAFPNF